MTCTSTQLPSSVWLYCSLNMTWLHLALSEGIKKEVSLSIFSNFIWCQIGFRLVSLNFYDFIFFYCGQASVGCDGQDEGDPETRGDDSER
jgi:hypothetical protein